MHSAGARAVREDDNEMSREAVLLQWEQKIEAAERLEEEGRVDTKAERPLERAEGRATAVEPGERRPGGRFARVPQDNDSPTGGKPALQLVEPDAALQGPRFER